jgi:hypothetical protein
MKNTKEGTVVRVVVCGPGPRRAEERVKVRKVEDGKVYVEGLKSPFSLVTGRCLVTFVQGMMVTLAPDYEPA